MSGKHELFMCVENPMLKMFASPQPSLVALAVKSIRQLIVESFTSHSDYSTTSKALRITAS